MARKQVTSVVVDIGPDSDGGIGAIEFWRGSKKFSSIYKNEFLITPRITARALEAQRLMLAKIEKAGQK